jgi:SAM-dependent MidA family methyltransferase
MSFGEYMRFALYDPSHGFYARGGRAGRGADFLTSPEVGPLFGAVLARALDLWWIAAGRPDPFVVVEVGAGPGTLARSIRYAAPECSPSLLYVLVEQSEFQRALHEEHLPGWMGERSGFELEAFVASPQGGDGPQFVSSGELPSTFSGVVLANELLDNLPFDIVRRRSPSAVEQLEVAIAADGELDLVAVDATETLSAEVGRFADSAPPIDVWFPWQSAARSWLAQVHDRLRSGHIVVFDYGAPTAELAARTEMGWLRTFRDQQRGTHPLDAPGSQDITCDVAIDQVQLDHVASELTTQADFLRRHGIAELVEQGRVLWAERAHVGDLAAIRGRSAIREAEALLEPNGLGAFAVLHWEHRSGA